MCGIAAIIGGNRRKKADLTRILAAISHRGEKKYFNESADLGACVLGMNRLAIVDRSFGKQPMRSDDGRYHVVFNGEIYNYKDLKRELKRKGYSFRTDSDTEVLVSGYAEWGSGLLKRMIGMYAFFIYDTVQDKYFAARDIFGVKPMYFADDTSGNRYFASEIKALAGLEEIKEIKLFPPAHYSDNGTLVRYWPRHPGSIDASPKGER